MAGVGEQYDVVVLGTGAAGLTAALAAAQDGARVGLFEKGEFIGGTTALSGAVCWIPNNRHMLEAGLDDSREDALRYLESLSHGLINPELAAAFVDTAPQVIDWLEESTDLTFQLVAGFPDYHPENPGGKPGGGRSLDPGVFSYQELGPWGDRVVMHNRNAFGTLIDIPLGGGAGIPEEVLAYRQEHDMRGGGPALVGALLHELVKLRVEPVTEARAVELQVVDGCVRGVVFDTPNGLVEVSAGAVVLATGGFEWDQQLVRDFLRGPIDVPSSIPTNTGDGLRMAMAAGVALGNMREAWWVPVAFVPGELNYGRQQVYHPQRERHLPGSIVVNRNGHRFTNEATNYNAFGSALHHFDPVRFDYANLPCWLIMDQGFIDRYGFGGSEPGDPSWLTRFDDLTELAVSTGIDPDGLAATVSRWNTMAAAGRDEDFGRGQSAYDRWNGDHSFSGSPRACLAPLTDAPYYVVELHSGTLGTKGGPKTTVDGQAIDPSGRPIPGLYAAGNAMAGVTGMVYGGAGGTIGPAMTFGYRAGRHAASMRDAAEQTADDSPVLADRS